MADKTLINLATGLEDAERMLHAPFSSEAPLSKQVGRRQCSSQRTLFALPSPATPSASHVRAARRSSGSSSNMPKTASKLLTCPICLNTRGLEGAELVANARVAGATPLWEWIGEDTPTVFSY